MIYISKINQVFHNIEILLDYLIETHLQLKKKEQRSCVYAQIPNIEIL